MRLRRGSVATWIHAIDGWTDWMTAQNYSPTTIRQWRWYLRRLAERHAGTSPWRLSTEDLYTWYGAQGWQPMSRKCARSALRSFYAWATTTRRAKNDPARDLPQVRANAGLPRPATDATIIRALATANDKERLMLLLALLAGLRCAEIATLSWDQVGADQLLVRGKGDHERVVPIHPQLAAELDAERNRRKTSSSGSGYRYRTGGQIWIFPGRTSGHVGPRWVSQLVSAALGPGVTAHQLRHRFATDVLAGSGNLATVQDLLGHVSPATTRIYTRISSATLRAAVDALPTI